MSTRPAKSPRQARPTAEDRADLAHVQRVMQDVAEGRDKLIPWDEAERELDEMAAREDEATAAERAPHRVAIGRSAAPKVSGTRRRAAGGR